jgi:hypothetical protein
MVRIKNGVAKQVKLAPAPVFFGSPDGPALATIYASHYRRMLAVIAAARAGDALLVELALSHYDKYGSQDA